MKIQRFILLFGLISVLLAACASPATPVPLKPTNVPTEDGSVAAPPDEGNSAGPMGGAAIHDLTPHPPVPTDNDTPLTFPANTSIVTWHREGGIAGFCNDVTVFANGAYSVVNCKDKSSQNGQLTDSQLLQLTRLVNKIQSFENENNDPAVADGMSVKTTFKGAGPLEASPEDISTVNNFAALLVAQVAPVSDSGAYPQAASRARDYLANELSISSGEIKIISVEAVEWSDRCLGVVIVGMMCAQGVTPGYRVVLEAQGQRYELHTDESGDSIQRVMDPNMVKP